MKYLPYMIVVPIILILSYGGCSSGGTGNSDDEFECVSKESIVDSECIAEDLHNICEPFFCSADFSEIEDGIGLSPSFFLPSEEVECIALGCSALDCASSGLFSEIEIGMNGRPTGLFDNNPEVDSNPVVEFFCLGSE